jgi:hypothetical protein
VRGHGGALDEATGVVQLGHVLGARHPHEDSPVELVDDQPLLRQRAERLAQGVAGDLQVAADLRLRQARAERVRAVEDRAADAVRDALGAAVLVGRDRLGPVRPGEIRLGLRHRRHVTSG